MNERSDKHPYRVPVATRVIIAMMAGLAIACGSGVILFLYQNRDYVRLTILQVFGI